MSYGHQPGPVRGSTGHSDGTTRLRDRIAEVIYSHEPCYIDKNPSCDCGRWSGVVAGIESHADHLATEITAELFIHSEADALGRRRYVTAWEATDG